MQLLRRTLHANHPIEFLAMVSSLVEAVQPEREFPRAGSETPRPTLAELVESFEGVDFAQTTAALIVISQLVDDEVMRARIMRQVAQRRQPMPAWLSGLDRARAVATIRLGDPLDDADNYLIGVELADGTPLSTIIYVDRNLGTAVKDAFLMPTAVEPVVSRYTEFAAAEGMSPEPADPGLTRAVVDEAIKLSAMIFPPIETDTWPVCRPLVRWMLRMLPEGTECPQPHIWSEQEQSELAERFLASDPGQRHAGSERSLDLVDQIIWLGTYDDGDPTRWSPVRVEILMLDRFPRKVMAPVADLAGLPDVLGDFVRFCHAERGIPERHTLATLAKIRACTPQFEQLIRDSHRPTGATALAGLLADADAAGDSGDRLEQLVGGRSNLSNLDPAALPDEPFEWAGVPEDIRAKAAEILALCDDVADRMLDVEHRTAQRRLLSRLLVGDPEYFRGRAAARTSAAAVVWMIARANQRPGQRGAPAMGELMAPFGGGSPTARVDRFLKILGQPKTYYGQFSLGSADLLVGSFRRDLIAQRDR